MTYHGNIFLGKHKDTYGEEGTGFVDYDPDFECGGPPGTPNRQCAYETTSEHTGDLPPNGRFGRNLYVNIASYRDPLCPYTLLYMYSKAKAPEKLFVKVLQQRDPEVDVDCLEEYCKLMASERVLKVQKEDGGDHGANKKSDEDFIANCPYKNQIYIHEIHAKEAAGPTWARGLLSQDIEESYKKGELKTQDHCMSLDSHMNFEPEWDSKMVDMWDAALNEYAVLSTYVQDVEHLGEDSNGKPHHQVPHLCMITYTTNVRTHATKCVNDLSKPKLTNAVWGAGLSFSKCHAELKVMVDPHTPHIFDGEEFNRAARFWTYGYDIYTPNHVYVLHDYHKSQSNPIMHTWHANSNTHGSFEESNKRLRTMIDLPHGEADPAVALRMKKSKYGLGDRRSLDQLIQFSGFDLRNEKLTIDGKNRCGNIQWVPFTEHPKGVNYIPEFDSSTEDPSDLPYEPSSVWYTPPVEDTDGDNNHNGLPEGATDLSAKHAELEGVLEGEEVLNMDLSAKHAELEEELEEEELVRHGLNREHEDLENQNVEAEDRNGGEDTEREHDFFDNPDHGDNAEAHANVHGRLVPIDDPDALTEELPEEEDEVGKNMVDEGNVKKKGNLLLRGDSALLRGAAKIRDKGRDLFDIHQLPGSGSDHGFHRLPLFVQVNVFLLIFGVIFFILKSAGTGRAFRRDERKRS